MTIIGFLKRSSDDTKRMVHFLNIEILHGSIELKISRNAAFKFFNCNKFKEIDIFYLFHFFLSTITIKVISSFKDMETSQERLFFSKTIELNFFQKKIIYSIWFCGPCFSIELN